VHDAQRIAGASPSPVISLLAGLGENPNRAILEHIQWLQDEIDDLEDRIEALESK